jgi:kinesin family protein 3/17
LQTFTFDAVYDWNSNQAQIYEETAKPIVESVMQGYNGMLGFRDAGKAATCN